jgi:hypothetical protein
MDTVGVRRVAALSWAFLGVAVLLLFALPSLVDVDLWGHMAMGRETLARGWPPLRDPFAYVPTLYPLIYHEWLSGVVFYLVLRGLGDLGLKALLLGLACATLTVALAAARRLGASAAALFVGVLIVVPSLRPGYLPIRPQLFTFLGLALLLLICVRARTGSPGGLWAVPPLMAVWANLHGGFVAGLGVLGLYVLVEIAARRHPWRAAAVGVAAGLATLVNPYGLGYWGFMWRALAMDRPAIKEWAPLIRYWASDWPSILLVLVAALSVAVARRRDPFGLLVLAATGYFALRHAKHVPLLAVAALVFVPPALTPFLDGLVAPLRARLAGAPILARLLAAGLAALTLLLAVDLALFTRWRLAVPAEDYPVGAVEFLRLNRLQGNLATPFQWGQYVLWKLAPDVRVSFDGRYETVYPEDVARANFDFLYGTGDWRRLLRDYPTEMVLVSKAFPGARRMAQEPGWTAVYDDAVSTLYLPAARAMVRWVRPVGALGTIP